MRRLLAIGLLSVFAVAGCGGGDGSWSTAQRDVFMNNCTSGAGSVGSFDSAQVEAYCQCTLDAVAAKYTPREVEELEQSSDPADVEEIMSIAESCVSHLQ